MVEYRGELTSDEDKKTHKLLSYLLEKIYKMDPTNLKFVGQVLGLVQGDEGHSQEGWNKYTCCRDLLTCTARGYKLPYRA